MWGDLNFGLGLQQAVQQSDTPMRCKTLESMNFVDLALTDDSAVAISSSVVLNFTFPEKILKSDKNGYATHQNDDSFNDDSENN